jgi:hypothetical protein
MYFLMANPYSECEWEAVPCPMRMTEETPLRAVAIYVCGGIL